MYIYSYTRILVFYPFQLLILVMWFKIIKIRMQIICSLAKLLNKWWHTLPNNSESPHKNRAYHAVGADATVYSMSGLRARYTVCVQKYRFIRGLLSMRRLTFFSTVQEKTVEWFIQDLQIQSASIVYILQVLRIGLYLYILLHSPITSRTCVIQIIQCTSISFTFPYQ